MRLLNEEQRSRLVEMLNEQVSKSTFKDIADTTGLSIGTIHTITRGHAKRIPESSLLAICKNLGINPYYVLEDRLPKYVDWKKAFYNS